MLAYLAILMPTLIVCCGIAVDVGLMQMHRLQMQSAADAAALGAESEIEAGNSNWASTAQADAGLNGFSTAGGATISVAMRPTKGAFAGYYDAVEATISQPQSTLFLKLLGSNTATIKARSVAVVTSCVYLTGANALSTYQFSTTSATVISTNCPYYIGGRASVDANTYFSAMAENVTGTAGNSTWATSSPAPPRYSAQTISDPLASISQSGISATCTSNSNTRFTISSNQTAGPGLSCGATSLTCSNSSTVTFSPGLYKFGGSLLIDSCNLAGTGVTFYFTKDANGTYGGLTLRNCTGSISAPTTTSSNGFAGILVMTDRNYQSVNPQDFALNSTNLTTDGIWYLTGAGMIINAGTLIAINYTGVVADNLVVKGSTFTSDTDFSTVQGGNPFRPKGGLVE